MKTPRVIIVMGVAGSGKSTVAAALAASLQGSFHDADDFHPPENIAKMAAGKPLDDWDREPWLARLRNQIVDAAPAGTVTVLACSALKKIYRNQLGVGSDDVALVYLQGSKPLLERRLSQRTGHFMKPGMLASQLATLEPPSAAEAFTIGIDRPVDEMVREIRYALGL